MKSSNMRQDLIRYSYIKNLKKIEVEEIGILNRKHTTNLRFSGWFIMFLNITHVYNWIYIFDCAIPPGVFVFASNPGSLKYGSGTSIRLWIDTTT